MDETCIKWQSRVVDTDAVAVANTDTLFTWYMIWLCWQSWAHVWLSPLFALWSKKNRKLKRQLALVRNKQTSVLFLMFSKQNWWWHQFAAYFFFVWIKFFAFDVSVYLLSIQWLQNRSILYSWFASMSLFLCTRVYSELWKCASDNKIKRISEWTTYQIKRYRAYGHNALLFELTTYISTSLTNG